MERMLVLVENEKAGQFTFLSIRKDSIKSLRQRLGKDWKVEVMMSRDKGDPKEHGYKNQC